MGGTKLIVPPHWEIRSQLTSIFGNVEDKRQQHATVNPEKVLILDGSSVFGGIEIRNY
jgi:predicted membrane protein